ncbi:uncharacterized protein LOC111594083 [Drosophila hydei]|uniref:Uncharacterized protein LOC111594083 n=1 Tax=Drosophila hydei TaxID=7224 RepID=A0A6J1LEV8_DROHY|nr:uncharacterized protein LOC111594083 [Drosophila hydei]
MSSPKAKPEHKKSITSPSCGSIMVGVTFDEGIVLAINAVNNLIYYLDDHIYCCASNGGFDRDSLIDVSTKLEEVARTNNHKGVTVAQALDLIVKVYEQAEVTELLLAGEDTSGLHLVALKSIGTSSRVNYAALGAAASGAAEYLKCQWRPALSVKQAEALARRAVAMGNMHKLGIDVCILFRRTPESHRAEFHDSS